MDTNTLLLIIVWFFIALLFIALLVLTFLYGSFRVRDNPKKALIFVKTGMHISRPIKGCMMGMPNQKGTCFNYLDKTLFVPHEYGDYYHRNKRMLFVNHIGQLVPMPFSDDVTLSGNEKGELIYELCASHIGADSMKALKGKSAMSILVVGIIAFVIGVFVVIGYSYMQDVMDKRQTQPSQQQQQISPVEVR